MDTNSQIFRGIVTTTYELGVVCSLAWFVASGASTAAVAGSLLVHATALAIFHNRIRQAFVYHSMPWLVLPAALVFALPVLIGIATAVYFGLLAWLRVPHVREVLAVAFKKRRGPSEPPA